MEKLMTSRIKSQFHLISKKIVKDDKLLNEEMDLEYIKEILMALAKYANDGYKIQVNKYYTKDSHDINVFVLPSDWEPLLETRYRFKNNGTKTKVTKVTNLDSAIKKYTLNFYPEREDSSADLVFSYLVKLGGKVSRVNPCWLRSLNNRFLLKIGVWTKKS